MDLLDWAEAFEQALKKSMSIVYRKRGYKRPTVQMLSIWLKANKSIDYKSTEMWARIELTYTSDEIETAIASAA